MEWRRMGWGTVGCGGHGASVQLNLNARSMFLSAHDFVFNFTPFGINK